MGGKWNLSSFFLVKDVSAVLDVKGNLEEGLLG